MRRPRWNYLWLVLGSLLAFSPALRNGFIWDDDGHVTRGDLQSLHGLGRIWFELGATEQYYPMLHTAFWVEHRLWGDAALGYHLVTVLLHAVAACLLVAALRKLAIPGAWLAGFLFAVHPVAVESVAWVAEQKNTLSACCYFASALCYLEFDERRRGRWYAASLGWFVAALLTKSVTAMLPVGLAAVLWWKRGKLAWRDGRPLAPFLAVGAGAGLFTAWVEHHIIGAAGAGYDLSWLARALLAGRVLWFYLGKVLWPVNVSFIYPRWTIDPSHWSDWLPALAALAAIAACWAVRRRTRAPFAAALYFCGTLLPVLGFFNVYPFRFSYVADHFHYLGRVGVIVPAAALVAQAYRRSVQPAFRRAWAVAGTALLVLFGVQSAKLSGEYRNNATLFAATVQRNPAAWMGWDQLGEVAMNEGRDAQAISDFERALALKPDLFETRTYLGVALRALGHRDAAVAQYRESIRLEPDYAPAHNALGVALLDQGDRTGAIAEFRAALRIWPDFTQAQRNLDVTLARPAQ